MREDKKQHLLLIPPLLHALPLSRPLEFSLFCFMIAALKGRTMVRLKLQTECQGGKDSIPRRSLNSPWNCGHNGTLACTCLFFLKSLSKVSWFPKRSEHLERSCLRLERGPGGSSFPIPATCARACLSSLPSSAPLRRFLLPSILPFISIGSVCVSQGCRCLCPGLQETKYCS